MPILPALLSPVLAALLALLAPTDPTVATRIVDEGLNGSQVMQHLDALVNGIGPRLTGSTNLARAESWAVETFRSFGLEARLEPWGEVVVGFDRGPQRGAIVAPERQELTFLSYAWTPGTGGPRRARAVAGPANADEFNARRDTLKGAYVLLSLAARSDTALRKLFDDNVAELQIAGLITPSRDDALLVMSGQMPKTADDVARYPRISLLAPQYRAIADRLEKGEAVELEFDIDNRFVRGPIPKYTVVAAHVGHGRPAQ